MLISSCLHTYLYPSFPFFLRLRQCLIEYDLSENDGQRPLLNALKYATSFPVIFLSAAQRLVVMDLIRDKGTNITSTSWHGEHPLFRLWQVIKILRLFASNRT